MARGLAGLAWLAAILLAQPAQAQPLAFVTGPAYPPFTGADLPQGGLAVALLEAALATQDRDIEVTVVSWEEAYARTVRGAVAGAFPYVRTAKRADAVAFSNPLIAVPRKLIAPAAAPIAFDGRKASLDGQRVCLPKGYAPPKIVGDMIATGRLTDLAPDRLMGCLHLLQRGRADFFVANDYTWQAVLARSPFSATDFHVVGDQLKATTLHVIVGQAHARTDSVLATVNAGLAAIRADGTLQAIRDRHLDRDRDR